MENDWTKTMDSLRKGLGTDKGKDPSGFCHYNSVKKNMKNYKNVGKTRNMAQSLLLYTKSIRFYRKSASRFFDKILGCNTLQNLSFLHFLQISAFLQKSCSHPNRMYREFRLSTILPVPGITFSETNALTHLSDAGLIFCSICGYSIRLLSTSKTAYVNPFSWRKT